MILALAILAYTVGAVLSFGLMFAAWQRSYPSTSAGEYAGDMGISIIMAFVWPVGLPALALLIAGSCSPLQFHGLKFR